MIKNSIRRAAEMYGQNVGFEGFQKTDEIVGILENEKITPTHIKQTKYAPMDKNFLLICPYPDLAFMAHSVSNKPVWIYNKRPDLNLIKFPNNTPPNFTLVIGKPQEFVNARSTMEEWLFKIPRVGLMCVSEAQAVKLYMDGSSLFRD